MEQFHGQATFGGISPCSHHGLAPGCIASLVRSPSSIQRLLFNCGTFGSHLDFCFFRYCRRPSKPTILPAMWFGVLSLIVVFHDSSVRNPIESDYCVIVQGNAAARRRGTAKMIQLNGIDLHQQTLNWHLGVHQVCLLQVLASCISAQILGPLASTRGRVWAYGSSWLWSCLLTTFPVASRRALDAAGRWLLGV